MSGQLISGVKIPRAWDQYNSQDPNGFVLQHSQLWDTKTFTSGSTRQLNFFNTANTQTSPDIGTNVFPYPQSVLVKAIGLFFKINPSLTPTLSNANQWPSRFDDICQIINAGVLTINLSKKSWGPFALWKLASGGGAHAYLTGAGGTTPNAVNYANVGIPSIDAAFRLIIPFVIPANSQATFVMSWPTTLTLQNGNPDLCLCLETVEAGAKT